MIKEWYVYLVECKDGSYYCGISKNVEGRIIQHNSGMGAKYTRGRKPVKLISKSRPLIKSEALSLEYEIKHTPKHLKIKKLEDH